MRNVHTHKPIDVRGGLISRRHRPAPAVHGGCEEAAGASLEHDLLVESDQKVCTGGRGESESSLRSVKGVRKGRVCPVHAARKDKKETSDGMDDVWLSVFSRHLPESSDRRFVERIFMPVVR